VALTYTEIEQQKSTRILIFFAVVLLFYFIVAVILGNITKWFFASQAIALRKTHYFLTPKELFYVLVFALGAAVLHSIYSAKNAINFIKKNLKAQSVDLSDKYHERFNNIVSEVNVATGNKYKITPMVIPTVAMNAFAVSDNKRNAIVGATEGLLSKLNRQQLQAIVAHEVGHVASGDSFQTTIGCSLFGIYAAMLRGLKKIFGGKGRGVRFHGRGGGGIIVFLLIIYLVLALMQFFYSMIRMFVSRDRELRADAIAVKITRDPLSLSSALYAISRRWRGVGNIDNNLESLFIVNPAKKAVDEKEGFGVNLFSTHPPIEKRIAILAGMAHADVKNIQEKVISQEKLRESTREIPAERKTHYWMATDSNGSWRGPFNIPQIMTLGWIRPETNIKGLFNNEIKQAKDEPFLKPLFDNRLQGLKKSSFNCPTCNQGLVQEEYEGTSVQRCVFCEGALVEQDKIKRIVIRKERGFSDRVKKMAELAQKEPLKKEKKKKKIKSQLLLLGCPKCGAKMIRNFYTVAYFIEVDRCNICNLIWFDKDELEMMQYLVENKKGGL